VNDVRFIIAAYAVSGAVIAGYTWMLMRRLQRARRNGR
jgi:hypothetical protein